MRRLVRSPLPLRPASFTLALVAIVACSPAVASRAPREGRDLLRGEEVPSQYRTMTALEMLQVVRPDFLRNRAQTTRLAGPREPVVYLDGARLAELSMLRHVATRSIVSVRYVRGINAVVRYGADHESGALFVTTGWQP